MATERQIAANRRNAQKSTGPRTAQGKAVSSRNHTRHGLYATSPVIPGLESETAWEFHRVTTVGGLAPANALEEALAERVALILWRLGRVARFEQRVTTRAKDQAPEFVIDMQQTLQVDVARIRSQWSDSRRVLRAFDRFLQRLPDAPMTGHDASSIVHAVANHAPGFDKASFAVPGLLSAADRIEDVPDWTVARIHQLVNAIAEAAGLDAADLVQHAATTARTRHAGARAPYRQLNRRIQHARETCVLPDSIRAEHLVRYETHLTRLLNQTLSQLRESQRHREATTRLRPAYNDYHVDVAADPFPAPSPSLSTAPAPARPARVDHFSHFEDSNPNSAGDPPSEPPQSDWHSAN